MRALGRLDPRARWLLAMLAGVNVAALLAYAVGLRINTTASMPLGLYRVVPYHADPLARDTLVAFCPTQAILAVAAPRRYLGPGPCPGNTEPLLKHVAAIGGDRVDVTESAVRVNGTPLPRSGRLQRDCAGRLMPRIPAGHYLLAPSDVWLFAPVARSWDSRYFGPQPAAHIVGIATPVLIVGEGRSCSA